MKSPESYIPAEDDAWEEARKAPWPKDRHRWSHPAVYLAGQDVGWFYVHVDRDGRHKARFVTRYRQLVREAERGADLGARCQGARDRRPKWLQRKESSLREWESGRGEQLRALVATENTREIQRRMRRPLNDTDKSVRVDDSAGASSVRRERAPQAHAKSYSNRRVQALQEILHSANKNA